jgi:formate dehydrogenase major subunit
VRKAVKNGAKLIVVNNFQSAADEIAARKFTPGDNTELLRGVLKEALRLSGKTSLNGFENCAASLANVAPSDDAKEIATMYVNAKKAVIIYEDHTLSPEAATVLADLAAAANSVNAPRSGIINLKADANSQSLADLGIKSIKEINLFAIKGLIVFGEDTPSLLGLDFLAVQDTHLYTVAATADVVLPAASFAETDGLFVNAFNEVRAVNAVMPSPTGISNTEQILKLAEAAGCKLPYRDANDITDAFLRARVKPQAEPCLQPAKAAPLNHVTANTNGLYNSFAEFLKSEGIN